MKRKRTDPRIERCLQALQLGNTRRAAARSAGIDSTTFYRWLADDPAFKTKVEEAEADAEVRHVSRIAMASAAGDWRPSAWWLERRFPADYGARSRVDLHVELAPLVEAVAAERGLDPAELMRELKRMLPDLPR